MGALGTTIYVIVMLLAGFGLGWFLVKRKLKKQIEKIDEDIKKNFEVLKKLKEEQTQTNIKREVRDDGRRKQINREREKRTSPRGESGTDSGRGESNIESSNKPPSTKRADEGQAGVQDTESTRDGEVKQSNGGDEREPEEDWENFD